MCSSWFHVLFVVWQIGRGYNLQVLVSCFVCYLTNWQKLQLVGLGFVFCLLFSELVESATGRLWFFILFVVQ
jgi:hypothetical protein